MPSIYTHDYFNKKVYPNLSKEAKEIIGQNIPHYLLGAQGPDFLFFNLEEITKNFNLGTHIHNHSFLNFYLPVKHILFEKTPVSAYLLGSIMHFYLDCKTHPTIDKLSEKNYTHLDIETELDRFYIKRKYTNIEDVQIHKLIIDPKDVDDIHRVYKNYPKINKKYICESIYDFKMVKWLFNPSTKFKEELLNLMLNALNKQNLRGIIMNKEPINMSENSNLKLTKLIDSLILKCPKFVDEIIQASKNKRNFPQETYYDYNGKAEF